MVDDRDYFQRQAESEVYLSAPIRWALVVLVEIGALLLILVAGLMFAKGGDKLGPTENALFAIGFLLLGIGCAYIGMRLLLLPSRRAHLLSPRGARITAYCVALIGALVIAGGFSLGDKIVSASGLVFLLVAFWLHNSAKRIRE